MKMSLFIAATMLLTSVASAQDPNYLVPFTQGSCEKRQLVVSIGDTPIDVEESVVDFELSKSSEDDSSATYMNADRTRILIVSYNDDMQVRASAYYLKVPSRTSANQLCDSFTTLFRVFYGKQLKGTEGYYKECGDAYLIATAKPIKIVKDWYVSLSLVEVKQ